MSCELCNPERRTTWFYKDKEFLIIECDVCHIPMLVTRAHTMHPDYKLIDRMVAKAQELFGLRVTFRTQQRKLLDHFHWHIIVK